MCDVVAADQPASSQQQQRRKVQQWRCDICQEKTFSSFEAASAHEEECRALFEPHQIENAVSHQTTTEIAAVESSFLKTPTIQREVVQVIDIASSPEVVIVPPSKRVATKRNVTKQASLFSAKASRSDGKSTATVRSKKASTTTKTNKNKLGKTIKKETTRGGVVTAASNGGNINIPVMFQGVDQEQLMAEQAAVEFRAKRLIQQKKDRERSEKRQKQQAVDQQSASFSLKPSAGVAATSQGDDASRAPRFPIPSHVIPSDSTSTLDGKLLAVATCIQPHNSKPWWRREATEPMAIDVDEVTSAPHYSLLSPKGSVYAKEPPALDCLQLALDAILIPPSETRTKDRIWADVYFNDRLLVDGFVPAHLKDISNEMIAFVQSWMAERQNAHDRAAERQRKLAKQQKPNQYRLIKKAKQTKSYADDDWLGSDNDEEIDGLKNLCHLTGPSGVGKSALVYAVAKHCGCRVIELNPSDKRGAAAIRKTIEEATQSHSSMAMLQKQEKASLLSSRLDDSDEDDAGEGKNSTLSVILIDEVDNLDAGDCGFWSALSDLTKRAKCPIFLTSNVQPEEMRIVAGRCGVLPLRRATPIECIDFVRFILGGEGFSVRGDDSTTTEKQLALVTELCCSDMRRIAHEMQLFATCRLSNGHNSSKSHSPSVDLTAVDKTTLKAHLQIDKVEPLGVRFDQYALLTIIGSGFLSVAVPAHLRQGHYDVDVRIGESLCPAACIMDDTTILAVAAPVPLPQSYRHFKRYHDEEYPLVSVAGKFRLGNVSTTPGVVSVAVPSGDELLQCSAPVILQRHFSDVEHDADGNDVSSGSEMEFGEPISIIDYTHSINQVPIDMNEVFRVLELGIAVWKGNSPKVDIRASIDECSMKTVKDLSTSAGLASDAALLDDVASVGQPHISGPCRGFGYDLTGAYPATTSENAKPPSADRLYASAWNDTSFFFGDNDCYMTRPLAARELNLLKYTESTLRGQSCHTLTANVLPSSVEEPIEKTKEPEAIFQDPLAEDSFLCATPPNCLASLASILRNAIVLPRRSMDTMSHDFLFDRRRIAKIEQEVDLLDEFVFPSAHPVTVFRFHRGLSREIDPLLFSRELADPILYQETLPMLRSMCVYEAVNKMIADSVKDDGASTHTRKRKTRNSRGEQHCLERISPMFRARDDDQPTSWEIGERLAASSLLFTSGFRSIYHRR